jgi:hypothetical protein
MITIGLINELKFIAESLKSPVSMELKTNRVKEKIIVKIENDFLDIWYMDNHIWTETLKESTSMFGIESCDNIAKIIWMIDSGDKENWRRFSFYDEKT